jgi:hypothetical protein
MITILARPLFALTLLACFACGCEDRSMRPDLLVLWYSVQARHLDVPSDLAAAAPSAAGEGSVVVISPGDLNNELPPEVVTLAPIPEGTVNVAVTAMRVRLGPVEVQSDSFAVESSRAWFKLERDASVPGMPEVRQIELRAPAGIIRTYIRKGQRYTFRFTAEGVFLDIKEISQAIEGASE